MKVMFLLIAHLFLLSIVTYCYSFNTFGKLNSLKFTFLVRANRRRIETDGHSRKLDEIIKDRYGAFKDAERPAPSKRRHRVSVSKHAFPVLELVAAYENSTFATEVEALVSALGPVKSNAEVVEFIRNLNKTLED